MKIKGRWIDTSNGATQAEIELSIEELAEQLYENLSWEDFRQFLVILKPYEVSIRRTEPVKPKPTQVTTANEFNEKLIKKG